MPALGRDDAGQKKKNYLLIMQHAVKKVAQIHKEDEQRDAADRAILQLKGQLAPEELGQSRLKKGSPSKFASLFEQTGLFAKLVHSYYQNCQIKAYIGEGKSFGDIALEQRIPRTATIMTKSECHFAVLSYESFKKLLSQNYFKVVQQQVQFMKEIPILKTWSDTALRILNENSEVPALKTKNKQQERNKKLNEIQSRAVVVPPHSHASRFCVAGLVLFSFSFCFLLFFVR